MFENNPNNSALRQGALTPGGEALGKKQKGTGFTNINKVLQANRGAGVAMGQQLAKNIGQQTQAVQSQLQQGVNQFNQSIGSEQGRIANTLQQTRNYIQNPIGQAPVSVAANQPVGGQAVTGDGQQGAVAPVDGNQPAAVAPQVDVTTGENVPSQAVAQANTLYNEAYGGLRGLENEENLSRMARQLQENAGLARNVRGQGMLLRNMIARPGQYSMAQAALDKALLGQSKEAQREIFGATRDVGSTVGQFSNVAASADARVAALEESLNKARGDIDAEASERIGAIGKEVESGTAQYKADVNRLLDLMRGYEIDPTTGQQKRDENNNLVNLQGREGDQELIDRAEELGMNLETAYGLNDADREKYIKSLTENLGAFSPEGRMYTGQQKEMLKNLADFRARAADSDVAKGIEATAQAWNPDIINEAPLRQQMQADADARQKLYQDYLDVFRGGDELYWRSAGSPESREALNRMFTSQNLDDWGTAYSIRDKDIASKFNEIAGKYNRVPIYGQGRGFNQFLRFHPDADEYENQRDAGYKYNPDQIKKSYADAVVRRDETIARIDKQLAEMTPLEANQEVNVPNFGGGTTRMTRAEQLDMQKRMAISGAEAVKNSPEYRDAMIRDEMMDFLQQDIGQKSGRFQSVKDVLKKKYFPTQMATEGREGGANSSGPRTIQQV